MSETPNNLEHPGDATHPDGPVSSGEPVNPAGAPNPAGPDHPAGSPNPHAASVPAWQPTAGAPRRSLWRDAVSTTGGTIAVAIAAASLGLMALLGGGLVIGAAAHHFGGGHGHGPWSGEARRAPMPGQGGSGEQGPEQAPRGQEQPRQTPGPQDLPNLGLPGIGSLLHGEAVIAGDGSATQTVLFQSGQVTDVTTDKLTVKSTDGFSATYTIGADSQKRLKDKVSTLTRGDEVTVIASKDNTTTIRILKTGRSSPIT